MRLRLELVLAAIATSALLAPVAAQEQNDSPTREDVARALDVVRGDPNIAPQRTVTTLRWARPDSAPEGNSWWQAVRRWLRGLFGWFAESGRYLVFVVGAILLVGLALYVVRLVGRSRGQQPVHGARPPPTHVRDLDIRPESLPDDIGGEAQRLWVRGEQRAALALLYRGLLSRLVHEHAVPIRASSTEGECVLLAQQRLAGAGASYAARLVGVWQAAVYGGLSPAAGSVEGLCAEFGRALSAEVAS